MPLWFKGYSLPARSFLSPKGEERKRRALLLLSMRAGG